MFIDFSSGIGTILSRSAETITGSFFLSLLLIFLLSLLFSFILRIPLDISVAIIFPIVLVPMAFMREFLVVGGLTLIYFAILSAKYFFVKF